MTASPTPRPAEKPAQSGNPVPPEKQSQKERPAPTGRAVQAGNPTGWVGLAVAVVVTFMRAAFNYTIPGVNAADSPARSVLLFLSLIGGVVAAVLGVVALASRRSPKWPGVAALAVGLNVFLVTVAAWVGSLVSEA